MTRCVPYIAILCADPAPHCIRGKGKHTDRSHP
jgi:hypothetical protein